jgi:hypothetical protein
MTENIIILLCWFIGLCLLLLTSEAIVNITRYFVNRKLLKLKQLEKCSQREQ